MDSHSSNENLVQETEKEKIRASDARPIENEELQDDESFSKIRIIMFSLMASFSAVNFGYSLGHTGYYMNIMSSYKIFYDQEKAIYSSIVMLGAAFGNVMFAFFLLKKIGRKYSLILCSLISLIGWGLNFLIINPELRNQLNVPIILYVSRFFNGIGFGGSTTVTSVYVAEISPSSIYSLTNTFHNFWLSLGFTLAYLLQYIISEVDRPDNYYGLLFLPLFMFCLQILQTVFAIIIPHSVKWLTVSCSKKDKIDSLIIHNTRKLYGTEYKLKQCLEDVKVVSSHTSKDSKNTLSFIKQKPTIKAMFVGIFLMFFQQFNGINPICLNALNIVKNTGIEKETVGSLIIGIFQLLGAFLAIIVTKKLSIKKNLVMSSTAMSLTHLLLGVYFKLWVSEKNYAYLAVCLLVCYILFFYISWGPIPYIVNSCIYKPEIVDFAAGIANMFSWLFSFAISYPYYSLEALIGISGIFFTFFVFTIMSTIFTLLFIPEMTNKPLSELNKTYDKQLLHTKF